MNIALTGSSGLIGSHLLEDLKEMGHQVLQISSSQSQHKNNIYSYDEIELKKSSFIPDYFFHLASINSNLTENEILLEVALANKVMDFMEILDCKNIIFFSTIKVYGDNSFAVNQFTEDSNLDPVCNYGKAKRDCEKVIALCAKQKNINFTILRMPPLMINHSKSNLGKLFQVVQKGIPIPTFKVGNKNQRSFLSYDLLLSVIQNILLEKSKSSNQIFNVADSQVISTNDLLIRMGEQLDKRVRFIYLPNFIFKLMMRINRLQLILLRLYGNFYISNAKLKQTFQLPDSA